MYQMGVLSTYTMYVLIINNEIKLCLILPLVAKCLFYLCFYRRWLFIQTEKHRLIETIFSDVNTKHFIDQTSYTSNTSTILYILMHPQFSHYRTKYIRAQDFEWQLRTDIHCRERLSSSASKRA